jgi:hypothetical protein
MIQKEKVFFSMNHLCDTFDSQTEILKMFLVKKQTKHENVIFKSTIIIYRNQKEIT